MERAEGVAAVLAVLAGASVAAFYLGPKVGLLALPLSATKVFAIAGILFIAAALALAVLEGLAGRRFKLAERELRAVRPEDAVAPYEGPEGDGLLFEGPDGRLLLLRPRSGLGAPQRVELPPAELEPGASTEEARPHDASPYAPVP